MHHRLLPITLALLAATFSCDDDCYTPPESFAQVAVSVVVTDQDGFAWENMEVHLLEAWNEWNACICKPPKPVALLTDRTGYAVFDPKLLAAAGVGFQEAPAGVAVLSSDLYRDQASIRLLVGHETIGWVRVDVPLSYKASQTEVWVKI